MTGPRAREDAVREDAKCSHTEHAMRSGVGIVGRYLPEPYNGQSVWEPCPPPPPRSMSWTAEKLAQECQWCRHRFADHQAPGAECVICLCGLFRE